MDADESDGFEGCWFDEEDARYSLRTAELVAYSSVITAFRAQGRLNDYKKVLLEHLRTSLFIPLERHQCEMRRAFNDDVLTVISSRLNPLTDVHNDWLKASESSLTKSDYHDQDINENYLIMADKLREVAIEHNRAVPGVDKALRRILHLPKSPYVPELLRQHLEDGEKDAAAILMTKMDQKEPPPRPQPQPVPPPPPPPPPPVDEEVDDEELVNREQPKKRGRKRHLRNRATSTSSLDGGQGVLDNNPTVTDESESPKPSDPPIKKRKYQKRQVIIGGVRVKPPKKSQEQKYKKTKKGLTLEDSHCARTEPFVFEPATDDGEKPPRGDPSPPKKLPASVALIRDKKNIIRTTSGGFLSSSVVTIPTSGAGPMRTLSFTNRPPGRSLVTHIKPQTQFLGSGGGHLTPLASPHTTAFISSGGTLLRYQQSRFTPHISTSSSISSLESSNGEILPRSRFPVPFQQQTGEKADQVERPVSATMISRIRPCFRTVAAPNESALANTTTIVSGNSQELKNQSSSDRIET